MFPTERLRAINSANEAAELSPLVPPDNLLSVYQTQYIAREETSPSSDSPVVEDCP